MLHYFLHINTNRYFSFKNKKLSKQQKKIVFVLLFKNSKLLKYFFKFKLFYLQDYVVIHFIKSFKLNNRLKCLPDNYSGEFGQRCISSYL